jgi:uncharacterized peroxidase-related enzyme
LVRALINDRDAADLTVRQRAIVIYAVKLTLFPGDMTSSDLDDMRSCGLTDRDVLDVNQVTAYFAYVNRVADGLGVATDDYAEISFTAIMDGE